MLARQPRFNSLFARLLAGACVPLLLFAVVVLVAGSALYERLRAQAGEQRSTQVIVLAYKQQHHLQQISQAVEILPLVDVAVVKPAYDAHRREFLDANREAQNLLSDDSERGRRLRDLRDLAEHWNALIEKNLRAKARPQPMAPGPPDLADQSRTYAERLQAGIADVIRTEEARLADRRAKAAHQTVESLWTIGAILVVCVLITVLFVRRFALSVTAPIDRLRAAANRLLAGRYETVPPTGPDEIAQLAVQFNHLGLSLTERVSSLESQHEGYRQFFGATAQLLWRANAAGAIDSPLPSWQAYTGMSEAAVRGEGWLDAVHAADREQVADAWKKAVAERSVFDAECRLRSADGGHRFFNCKAVPVLNPDNTVREWIGTCTDMTERIEKARLQREKEAAEAASKAKTEFLTKMSHELRTPLNAVIGMSKMLTTQRFGPLKPKQADYVEDIARAGEHLLMLINDILDLSNVEAGRMAFQADHFPINEVLTAVVSTLRPLADAKKQVLRIELPEDGTLATDPARLKQVLYNLLSNGIKFTGEGGSVTIRCQWVASAERHAAAAAPGAAAVRIEVSDTGVGIATADQARIWDEFYQLPSSHPQTAGNEGTGLGLALTQNLVQRLGGTIWLVSESGKGSTFAFVIPRELPPPPPTAADADGQAAARPLALVVEDHPPTHKLLVDWLTGAGLRTASAFDGEAALELVRDAHPQLIVLDIKLPKVDGWQVLSELKHDPATADIPVAVVTVSENSQPVAELGVQEFFVKPLNADDFLRRLRALRPALFGAPLDGLATNHSDHA